jgi:hypothetical protein
MRGRIERLAAGSLGPLAAGRLRRHMAGCPTCTAEWEEITALYADLRTLRRDTTPHRPAPDWPAAPSPHPIAATLTIGKITMKRRTALLAACGTLLFCVTGGAIAAKQWGGLAPYGQFQDRSHRRWTVRSTFAGTVTLTYPSGHALGTYFNEGGSADGRVRITGYGREFTLTGPGRYPLRDAGGKVLAYAIIEPTTGQRSRDILRESVLLAFAPEVTDDHSGVMAGTGGVAGYEASLRIRWRVRGFARVKLHRPRQSKPLLSGATNRASAEQVELLLDKVRALTGEEVSIPETPEIEWRVDDGAPVRATGYGAHPIAGPDGVPLAELQVDPPLTPARGPGTLPTQ